MSRIDAHPAEPDGPSSPSSVQAAPSHPSLGGAIRSVFSVTLLSRFGGLARDVVVARVFQDSVLNSAFQFAFAIPNMFRRLFGEGALSAAFIPEYAACLKSDRDGADRLASLTVAGLGVFTSAATALIELVLLALLLLLPAHAERELSITLTMVMLPFMPLICTVAILAGMLQVHGRYAASATGPLVLNAFILVVGIWAIATGRVLDQRVAYLFAGATTMSGLTQAVWFARLLRAHVRWRRDCREALPLVRAVLRRFVPVLVGLGALQLGAFLDQVIAMWPIWVGPTMLGFEYPLDGGSAGILAAAQRLYQFPLGVFGIAVATAVFPMLARHAAEPHDFQVTLRRGLRLSLLLGLPASAGLVLVRTDLTHVLYAGSGSGRSVPGFSALGVARAADVVMGYAPAIWAFSINHVLARAFYAKGNTLTPMRVSLALVGVNFVGNILLIWPLREAGLAWSTSISSMVQAFVLVALLQRVPGGQAFDRETLLGVAKVVAATLVMIAVCAALLSFWRTPDSLLGHGMRLVCTCGVGLGSFAAAAFALGAPEIGWLLHPRGAEPR